jgi:PilZ domain
MTKSQSDRRTFRRAGSVEHRIGFARVRPGHPVAVIDLSAGGAFIELSRRLLPGSIVDLQLDTPQRRTTLRGRVLRCAVACLASTSVSYRAAIAFDHQCLWLGDGASCEYSVPVCGSLSSRDIGVSATPDAV